MKKRVLISGYTRNFGGIERTTTNLFLLNKDEYIFDFLCSENNKPIDISSEFKNSGSNVFYFNTSIKKHRNGLKHFFKQNCKNYDAVLVNFGDLTDSFFLKYAKKYGIRKRIAYAHMGSYNSSGVIKKVIFFICKLIIHFYATSFFSYSETATKITYLKVDRKKTKVFFPLFPGNFFFDKKARKQLRDQFSISAEDIVIGCVGSISSNKNQLGLFTAVRKAQEISEKKLTLVFIGNVVENDYWLQMLKELSANKTVRVIKLDNQCNIGKYYSMFDIYISASKKEGFGLTIVESYISGLPILVNRGSIPELLLRSTNSLEISLDDTNDFAQAIKICLKSIDSERCSRSSAFLNNLIGSHIFE